MCGIVGYNGIIENYLQLRGDLKSAGHTFKSDTDTECHFAPDRGAQQDLRQF